MNTPYLIICSNKQDLKTLRKIALYSSIYQHCIFCDNISDYNLEKVEVVVTMTHSLLSLVKLKCLYKRYSSLSIIVLADGENLSILKALSEDDFIILSSNCKVKEFKENLLYLTPKDKRFSKITEREKEVLSLILQGQSNYKIANQLGISERTIEAHRRNIYLKVGVHSVSQLTIWALNNNLLKQSTS